MKEQEKKHNKKKILLTYLILAVCLLVIAAITVTIVFTVNRGSDNLTIDNPQQTPDDGNDDGNSPAINPDDGNDDDDDAQTSTDATFVLPVKTATVTNSHAVFHYDLTLDCYYEHQGMDFEGAAGDEVYAVLDGTVETIVLNDVFYGSYITLSHDNGITTTYKFIDVNENLKVGDSVKRGSVIGTIASACGAEYKQGEHLHFELYKNGKLDDPTDYLDISEK